MVGSLFLPENYKEGEKLPAVPVVGLWLNVKEQVATDYATCLTKKGVAGFVFDLKAGKLQPPNSR